MPSCIMLCLSQGFATSQFSWFQVISTLWVVLESSQCRRSSICYGQFKLLAEQHNFRTYLSATQLIFMEMIGDVCWHGGGVPFPCDSSRCPWQLRRQQPCMFLCPTPPSVLEVVISPWSSPISPCPHFSLMCTSIRSPHVLSDPDTHWHVKSNVLVDDWFVIHTTIICSGIVTYLKKMVHTHTLTNLFLLLNIANIKYCLILKSIWIPGSRHWHQECRGWSLMDLVPTFSVLFFG